MREIYVYYKLRFEDAVAAHAAFEAARGQAVVRLLQRSDGAELLTWMEVYAPEQAEVQSRIAEAMAPFAIRGERHSECFEALATASR